VDCDEIAGEYEDLSQVITKIEGNFILKEGMPTEIWGIGLSVNMNESFKAAFFANSLGFHVDRLQEDFEADKISLPAGSFIISGKMAADALSKWYDEITVEPVYLYERPDKKMEELKIPRIALAETNMHDMDAGWTRFLFDTYHIPYTILKPGDFEKTDFKGTFDVVIFPGNNKDILMEGKYKSRDGEYYMSSYPPEFVKGMGKKGFEKLLKYIDEGGKVISWGSSTELFIGVLSYPISETESESFKLPVNNISERIKDFSSPGSWLRVNLLEDHPLTYGMPPETGAFMRSSPVFSTEVPMFDMDRRVIATFPEKDILVSGYVEKEELIGGKAAMVWVRKGKGQLVLYAFHPQFRNSTAADYKLLFNAILLQD
jgi:hypothetical protein